MAFRQPNRDALRTWHCYFKVSVILAGDVQKNLKAVQRCDPFAARATSQNLHPRPTTEADRPANLPRCGQMALLPMLLGITARRLHYLESAGKAHYRLVGHRKLYSISEVRRLLATRELGHKPVKRQEKRQGMLRWASRQLAQK